MAKLRRLMRMSSTIIIDIGPEISATISHITLILVLLFVARLLFKD